MKKFLVILVVLGAAAIGLVLAFRQMRAAREAEGKAEAPVAAESRIKRAADGSVLITVDLATQERVGLKTAAPAPGQLSRELKAYGRILDPTPLAALLMEVTAARTALDASSRELERVKALAQEQNASARALEAATAAMKKDQIALDAAQLRVLTGWGSALASHPDLPGLVKSLAAQETALVRLDLPAGEASAPPQGARLLALAGTERPVAAQFLGPAADVEPQTQGQGFLFLAKGDSGLRPGQAVIGFIQQPGEPLRGLAVPASAVIRAAGKAWVYLQTGEGAFTRREVGLEHPTETGWLVPQGLSPTDRMVIAGAQVLFSEEQKSRIQMGD